MSEGCFGRVQDTQTEGVVIKKPRADASKYIRSLQNEVRIYKILDAIRPRLQCIPRFYTSDTTRNDFLMQKIVPSLKNIKIPSVKFFSDAFACLSHLHQYILHMDLNSSNIGYRKTTNEIVFFDFGNSVTIEDLKIAGISSKAIDLYRYSEMQELCEIFETAFPDYQSIITESFDPYTKRFSLSQENIRLKTELMDKAFQVISHLNEN